MPHGRSCADQKNHVFHVNLVYKTRKHTHEWRLCLCTPRKHTHTARFRFIRKLQTNEWPQGVPTKKDCHRVCPLKQLVVNVMPRLDHSVSLCDFILQECQVIIAPDSFSL